MIHTYIHIITIIIKHQILKHHILELTNVGTRTRSQTEP